MVFLAVYLEESNFSIKLFCITNQDVGKTNIKYLHSTFLTLRLFHSRYFCLITYSKNKINIMMSIYKPIFIY